jgi:dTDP-4-amino-4,6-dideoxygalactose transaminase
VAKSKTGKLAINGGAKTVTLSQERLHDWPLFGGEEDKAVLRVMHAGYGSYAEMARLEDDFKAYTGAKYALSVNNGTAALHSAFYAVGVGPGDEVISPSYTYWATVLTALNLGAAPVFADTLPETLTIDPADIERKITKRTKAIVVVHLWGMPCEMDEIMRIARRHKIKVVEDAAQAVGATYKGKKCGTIGDVGTFSMQASKVMPAIEGGMITTNNKRYLDRCRVLGHYGTLAGTPFVKYNKTGFGFKYRIHPLAAAIARVQLGKLEEMISRRNSHVEYFCKKIAGLPGLRQFIIPKNSRRVYYGFRLQYLPEELGGLNMASFVAALGAEGVQAARERYSPLHMQPIFTEHDIFEGEHPWNMGKRWKLPNCYGPGTLPNTEKAFEGVLSLPVFHQASKKLIDQYASALRKVIENADRVPRTKAKLRQATDGARAKIR